MVRQARPAIGDTPFTITEPILPRCQRTLSHSSALEFLNPLFDYLFGVPYDYYLGHQNEPDLLDIAGRTNDEPNGEFSDENSFAVMVDGYTGLVIKATETSARADNGDETGPVLVADGWRSDGASGSTGTEDPAALNKNYPYNVSLRFSVSVV